MMGSVLLMLLLSLTVGIHCQRPASVNIGAILTFESAIGGVAKEAIKAAVDDINADSSILGGTKLNLLMKNLNCSVFVGSVEAFQLLEKGVVAMIGPQSSSIAHMVSFIANGVQT